MRQNKRIIAWAALVTCLAVCVAALAIAPRGPEPAKPARPVQIEGGVLAGHVICVDAGHGGADGGARARDSKTWEKELNLRIATLLADLLEQSGATVLRTRTEDMQYDANKRKDLTARMNIATDGGADLLVSIHMNEYRTRAESGPQVFYRAGQENSRLLAGALQASLISHLIPRKERVAMAGDYFILSLTIPSVLVECGFISNAEEEKLLLNADYQAQVAQAVHDGIVEYFLLQQEK